MELNDKYLNIKHILRNSQEKVASQLLENNEEYLKWIIFNLEESVNSDITAYSKFLSEFIENDEVTEDDLYTIIGVLLLGGAENTHLREYLRAKTRAKKREKEVVV